MRNLRWTRLVVAAGAAAVALASLGGCAGGSGERPVASSSSAAASSSAGEMVAVSGVDFDGKRVDTADYAGDVVVLNVWYSACGPCRSEAPVLAELATTRAADGVHVVGVNSRDTAQAAREFQRTYGVPYPSIDDSSGKVLASLAGIVPVNVAPVTVIVDRSGKVSRTILGQLHADELTQAVDAALG